MSAWGRTGRVWLEASEHSDGVSHVLVDGGFVGMVAVRRNGTFRAGLGLGWRVNTQNRDAAVMWVLRRVDPALWRQERGEVWSVRKLGRRGAVIEPWHIHRAPETPRRFENCGCEDDLHEDSHSEQADALRAALAYISKAALR